jgi:hypothetical protein
MCVIVKPMIGDWAVPRIDRIGTVDRRRLARLSVPGLAGGLHHDLGSHSVAVDIEGSLQGDEERDEFLQKVRANLLTGDPLTFVADITTATELELVVIEGLEVEEVNDAARSFRYRIRVRQYVEPPEPPAPGRRPGSRPRTRAGAAGRPRARGARAAQPAGRHPLHRRSHTAAARGAGRRERSSRAAAVGAERPGEPILMRRRAA